MRSFPRALRPRPRRHLVRALGVAALLGVLVSGALTPVTHPRLALSGSDDHLRDRQRHVKHRLSAAQSDLAESSARARRTALALQGARADLATARDALSVARAKVQVARIKDEAAQHDLELAVARLARARTDLVEGQHEVRAKRREIGAMLVDSYQQGGDPQLLNLAALLNSTTAAELASQEQTGSVVIDVEVQAYDELRAAEVLLRVREQEVSDAKDDTAAKRREAAALLEERRSSEQEAESAAAAYRAQVVSAADAKRAADEARAADQATIRRLEKEQDRIEEMLRQRAAAASAGHHGAPQPSGGYLSYPVNGPVTSPFGYRVHPIYGYYSLHDGTDFGASCGAPLYSAADGVVVSSYWNTAYGNRMIIDNGYARGVGLATIYNHATRYTVGVGAHVERGEVIGYVGSTGWSTGCHLHFTVMVNGKPVDPMGWL